MNPLIPALVTTAVAVLVGLAAHRGDHWSSRHRGSGEAWSRVVLGLGVAVAPLLLLSSWLEILAPTWWEAGHHLFLDLTGAFEWSLTTCYAIALGTPLLIWTFLVAMSFGRGADQDPREGHWLVGGVGFRLTRRWVLIAALPFAALLVAALPRLGGGPGAYPAAGWSTLLVVCLSLIGVSESSRPGDGVEETIAQTPDAAGSAEPSTIDWVAALEDEGVEARTLVTLEGRGTESPPPDAGRRDLEERLQTLGARAVAPELVRAVGELLAARDHGGPPVRVIAAPDGAGQIEVTALAARLVGRRGRAHTLVVTAGDVFETSRRLGRWLPEGDVTTIGPSSDVPAPGLVWVCDVETLSERLLPELQDPRRIERLGLVVWWSVHEASGVPAAHLGATARRLHRLLDVHGRPDLRTLVFLRRASHPDAQLAPFVERLLPLPVSHQTFVDVPAPPSGPVDLHLLEGFRPPADGSLSARFSHLPFAAARASLVAGFPTALDTPASLAGEGEAFWKDLGDTGMGARRTDDIASAAARIHPMADGEALALSESFGQGGRARRDGTRHHVGLIAPENPYVADLLEVAARTGGTSFGTSRRLLPAEPRGELARRHLLRALSELPDTRRGLLRSFRWDDALVRRTLAEIAREGHLTRREVRSLDASSRLVIDHQYQIRSGPTGETTSLDTAALGTASLVDVRDPSEGGGVKRRLPRELLAVVAYPHRVFTVGRRRYRIDAWRSLDEVAERGFVACTREDEPARTWRRRHLAVYGVTATGSPATVGRGGRSFRRQTVGLTYEEEVHGVVRTGITARRGTRGTRIVQLDEPIFTSFETRALLLGFPRTSGDGEGPISLAETLRHVVPVHLGVDGEALEVVPLLGDETDDGLFGVALVDLHPGGLGLVDAFAEDGGLLTRLLRQARQWLERCGCHGGQGRGCVLRTPAAQAAAMDHPPTCRAAVAMLKQAV